MIALFVSRALIRGARLRYPILQRHLYDSRCARNVKNGVKLFNVNDYPFPCPERFAEASRSVASRVLYLCGA